MAQTDNYASWCDCEIQISTNCSDYTDISGWANSVTWDGFERMSGEAYTFDGDTPLLGFGPRGPGTVTIRCIYDETTASNPLDEAIASYETDCGGSFCISWSPLGGDGAEYTYTTVNSKIVNPPYTGGAKDDATPIMFEVTVRAESVAQS